MQHKMLCPQDIHTADNLQGLSLVHRLSDRAFNAEWNLNEFDLPFCQILKSGEIKDPRKKSYPEN